MAVFHFMDCCCTGCRALFLLESAINLLVDEFIQVPYAFFTEADAVSRFHQMLDADPAISRQVKARDGFTVGLVHREYPTFFRFSDKNPTARRVGRQQAEVIMIP